MTPMPPSRRTRRPESGDSRPASSSRRARASVETEAPRRSSRRQPAQEGYPANAAAATRRDKPPRGRSSQSSAMASTRVESQRRPAQSGRRPSRAGGEDDSRASGRASQRRGGQRREPPNRTKQYIILGVVGVLVILGIASPFVIQSWRESSTIAAYDEAVAAAGVEATLAATAPPAVSEAASAYLGVISYNQQKLEALIAGDRLSPTAEIALIAQAANGSKGNVAMVPTLLAVAIHPDNGPAQHTAALSQAAALFDSDRHADAFLPLEVTEWARPSERPDAAGRARARAAISVLSLMHPEAADLVAEIARDTKQDPIITEAAISSLASRLRPTNVGYGIGLLLGSNSDQASRNDALMEAIFANVQAAHLGRVLDLWEHPNERIAALGFRAVGGPRVYLGESEADQRRREEIGGQVSQRLSAELFEESPIKFSALLDAVHQLRLTGTRDTLLEIVPAVDDSNQGKIAGILAGFVVSGSGVAEANEAVVSALGDAMDDDERRSVAARALGAIKVGNIVALRPALEKLIAHGSDATAFAAANHIVGELYRRKDVTERLGDDLNAWVTFLAEDKPRFTYFEEAKEWYAANKQKIRVSDADTLPANKHRTVETIEELSGWVDGGALPIPLGLDEGSIKAFVQELNTFKYALIKATPM